MRIITGKTCFVQKKCTKVHFSCTLIKKDLIMKSKTKRIIISCILTLLSLSALSAAITEGNRQEIVPVDSPIYRAMKNLYISTGLALPSTTGPWSMAEMDMMLDRINPEELNAEERATFDYLVKEIGKSPRFEPKVAEGIFGFTISGDVAAEMYAHTNPDMFQTFDDWGFSKHIGDYTVPAPMISVPLETWFGNNIYGYSEFSLGLNRTLIDMDAQKNAYFLTNILMVPPTQLNDLNLNFPYRAFGSIGGGHWNISIGREQLRWGPGESGNLTIGDQIKYHNNLRFTAFSKVFKYTFSISSFVHPANYLNETKNELDLAYSQTDPRKGLNMFIAHRLEWRILDKVNMALTESIMYQSEDNQFDLLTLSPTAIFHNFYIRSNSNSLLSFEVDYTFLKHWNVYGEVVIDEFRLPGEFDTSGPPSASGYLLGVKTAYPLGKGILSGSIEGVYTDPFLYLRDNGEDYSSEHYGINFVVATPDFKNSGDSYYDLEYLGYRYGNDSIVGNLNLRYEEYGKWSASFDFVYWADGTMDKNSKWHYTTPGVDDPSAPTSEADKEGSWDPDATNYKDRNAVAHHLIFTLSGGYTVIDNLDIYSQLRFASVINYNNIKGDVESDLSFALGVSYSF